MSWFGKKMVNGYEVYDSDEMGSSISSGKKDKFKRIVSQTGKGISIMAKRTYKEVTSDKGKNNASSFAKGMVGFVEAYGFNIPKKKK